MGDVPLIGLTTLFVGLGILLSNELGYEKFNLLNQSTQSREIPMIEINTLRTANLNKFSVFENIQMIIIGVISSELGALA